MATAGGGSSRMKWITDLEKTVLLSNFEKRGWMRGSSEGRVFCDVKQLILAVSSDLKSLVCNFTLRVCVMQGKKWMYIVGVSQFVEPF